MDWRRLERRQWIGEEWRGHIHSLLPHLVLTILVLSLSYPCPDDCTSRPASVAAGQLPGGAVLDAGLQAQVRCVQDHRVHARAVRGQLPSRLQLRLLHAKGSECARAARAALTQLCLSVLNETSCCARASPRAATVPGGPVGGQRHGALLRRHHLRLFHPMRDGPPHQVRHHLPQPRRESSV